MGWKWNEKRAALKALNIGLTEEQLDAIDGVVTAKKHELAAKLEALAAIEDTLGKTTISPSTTGSYHDGRAAAFREVRDAVKPKAA